MGVRLAQEYDSVSRQGLDNLRVRLDRSLNASIGCIRSRDDQRGDGAAPAVLHSCPVDKTLGLFEGLK